MKKRLLIQPVSKQAKVILQLTFSVIAMGIAVNLVSDLAKDSLQNLAKLSFYNYNLLVIGILTLIGLLVYGIEILLPEKVELQESFRQDLLRGLADRYGKRFTKKMNEQELFDIQVGLRYTTEGTDSDYALRYFAITKQRDAGDFEQLFKHYTNQLKRLLIIGPPGSGKTVLLLKFALKLVDIAKLNHNYPIPVIINLASWRKEENSLNSWMEQSLVYALGEYGSSKKVAKQLANSNNLLLLLDGLDEVPTTDQDSCLQAIFLHLKKINVAHKKSQSFPEVIICCRQEEYSAMNTNAFVQATVQIQPLSPQLILDSLNSIRKVQGPGNAAGELLKTFAINPELVLLLTTTFYVQLALNIVDEDDFDIEMLSSHRNLLKSYINLQLKKLASITPISQSYHWLGWLAKQLLDDKRGISFELTDMQPTWLHRPWLFSIFRFIITATPIALLIEGFFNDTIAMFLMLLLFVNAFLNKSIKPIEILELHFSPINLKTFLTYLIGTSLLTLAFAIIFLKETTFTESLKFSTFLCSGFLVLQIVSTHFFKFKRLVVLNTPYRRFNSIWKYLFSSWISSSLFFLFINRPTFESPIAWDAFPFDIYVGFYIVLLVFLWYSSLFLHLQLRLFLAIEKKTPLRLIRFLDVVAQQTGLMEKDGGQWRFRHLLIQQMLADFYRDRRKNQ